MAGTGGSRRLLTAFGFAFSFIPSLPPAVGTRPSSFITTTTRHHYAANGAGGAGRGDDWSAAPPVAGLQEHNAAVAAFKMEVLYEDEHMAVVNKPPGLLCVAGVYAGKKDSLAALVARHFRHKDVARTVVHRLDQGTSGVVCFARNEDALRDLHAQFRDKSLVQKKYTALVWGKVEDDEGTIDLPIRKDLDNPPKQMVDLQQGKPSLTEYRVRQTDKEGRVTHVDLVPITGRTHQLRLHMSAIGHPILGDPFYYDQARGNKAAPPGAIVGGEGGRLCLHAEELRLRHPVTGKPLVFSSPCPFALSP